MLRRTRTAPLPRPAAQLGLGCPLGAAEGSRLRLSSPASAGRRQRPSNSASPSIWSVPWLMILRPWPMILRSLPITDLGPGSDAARRCGTFRLGLGPGLGAGLRLALGLLLAVRGSSRLGSAEELRVN